LEKGFSKKTERIIVPYIGHGPKTPAGPAPLSLFLFRACSPLATSPSPFQFFCRGPLCLAWPSYLTPCRPTRFQPRRRPEVKIRPMALPWRLTRPQCPVTTRHPPPSAAVTQRRVDLEFASRRVDRPAPVLREPEPSSGGTRCNRDSSPFNRILTNSSF
jgi:hypothetical protein